MMFVRCVDSVLPGIKMNLYVCPCGETDHYATRTQCKDSQVGDDFSDVLHCREHKKQWFVGNLRMVKDKFDNVKYVQEIIRSEEEIYLKLLENAPKTIAKFMRKYKISDPKDLSGELLAILRHTHGLDPSVVEGACNILFSSSQHECFQAAFEEHKLTGKGK